MVYFQQVATRLEVCQCCPLVWETGWNQRIGYDAQRHTTVSSSEPPFNQEAWELRWVSGVPSSFGDRHSKKAPPCPSIAYLDAIVDALSRFLVHSLSSFCIIEGNRRSSVPVSLLPCSIAEEGGCPYGGCRSKSCLFLCFSALLVRRTVLPLVSARQRGKGLLSRQSRVFCEGGLHWSMR